MKISKNIKTYKRTVNNKMASFGETDLGRKTVKINKTKAKKSARTGELIDSIVHEKEHILHPNKKEQTVRRDTAKKLTKMTPKQKKQHYGLFKAKA